MIREGEDSLARFFLPSVRDDVGSGPRGELLMKNELWSSPDYLALF